MLGSLWVSESQPGRHITTTSPTNSIASSARRRAGRGRSCPATVLLAPDTTDALHDEVLGLGVGDDDRRGRLLGLELEFLGELDADTVDLEQVHQHRLVLEVGARGVAPRVARAAVLLPEQAGEARAVL